MTSISSIRKPDLEINSCPICNSSDKQVLHDFDPYKVVLCNNCSLTYLSPRLKETVMIEMYREHEYFSDHGGAGYQYYNYNSQEKSLRLTFRKFLNELEKINLTSGRLLELGCGYGYFLDEARKYYSYTAGLELSEEAGNHARKISGADIFVGDLRSLPVEARDFDVIVTINVIEHIYQPAEFLVNLKERLVKDGIVIIATPDIGSFWYRIMKSKWSSFKIPEHVVFYSNITLISLLERAGFINIRKIPFIHAFPLGLITSKLGLNLHNSISQTPIWLPKTMTAFAAQAL